jgi:hypothetical protein
MISNLQKLKNVIIPKRLLSIIEKSEHIKFYELIDRRKYIELTDVVHLSQDIDIMNFKPYDIMDINAFYGGSAIMKKYCNLPKNYFLKTSIQHGIKFGEAHWQPEISKYPITLAWGHKTAETFQRYTRKKIIPIGSPYFYAESLININEIETIKKNLGKNLLVFPAHSTHNSTLKFNIKEFIKQIINVSAEFKTIRICLYWKDCTPDIINLYKENGMDCVTAGHLFDQNFYGRLKSLIEISDATLSNAIGSYIGYSIFSNKPHLFLNTRVEFNFDKNNDRKTELNTFETDSNYQFLEKALANSDFKITDQIKNILDIYWGYSCVMKPNQLIAIFEDAERIFNKSFRQRMFYSFKS